METDYDFDNLMTSLGTNTDTKKYCNDLYRQYCVALVFMLNNRFNDEPSCLCSYSDYNDCIKNCHSFYDRLSGINSFGYISKDGCNFSLSRFKDSLSVDAYLKSIKDRFRTKLKLYRNGWC